VTRTFALKVKEVVGEYLIKEIVKVIVNAE
jgi:hypothetical protein